MPMVSTLGNTNLKQIGTENRPHTVDAPHVMDVHNKLLDDNLDSTPLQEKHGMLLLVAVSTRVHLNHGTFALQHRTQLDLVLFRRRSNPEAATHMYSQCLVCEHNWRRKHSVDSNKRHRR